MKSQNKIKLRDVLDYTNLYSYIESVNNPDFEENINRNILHQDNHYYNLKFQDHNIISSFISKEEIKDKDYQLQLQFISIVIIVIDIEIYFLFAWKDARSHSLHFFFTFLQYVYQMCPQMA